MEGHQVANAPSESSNAFLGNTLAHGIKTLESLKNQLQTLRQQRIIAPWLRQLDALSKRSNTQVIIGVVGATGSGKSSVINALLGEKQLIPTNCMRACTAVVTEISYNHRANNLPWRATIEFVSEVQWRKELEVLLGDVETAISSIDDEDSEAGIAWAKISAVYPSIDKKNIAKATVDELMQKPEVKTYLGTELAFEANTTEEIYMKLKHYIDSKEKLSVKFFENSLNAPKNMDAVEYWPMIRKVSIFGKDSILESGCVLVDLPGVADSNQARAAVAKSYIKNCAALWVVAPIIRAPDEKAARYLLGEGFKRQLHRDGTLSRLTFICSKTDELVIHEARSVLNYDPEFAATFAAIDMAKTQITKDRRDLLSAHAQARKDLNSATQQHTKLYKEEQVYRQLRAMAVAGNVVHPPLRTALSTKKKTTGTPASPQKRLAETAEEPQTPTKRMKADQYIARASQPPSIELEKVPSVGHVSQHESSATVSAVLQDTSKPAIVLSDIDLRLQELKQRRATLNTEKDMSREQIDTYKSELDELKSIEAEIREKEWVACALGRNKYSSNAIQKDFAAGLKDLSSRINPADDDDDENNDPGLSPEDGIDQEAPISLPVFCVSSQGYQKIRGQLEGERSASMFSEVAHTGIPALRQHAFNIGKAQMETDDEAFVNDASRLLGSLRLWCLGTGDNTSLSAEEDNTELAKLAVDYFIENTKNICHEALSTVEKTLKTRIFDVLPKASSDARNEALATVDKWLASWKAPVDPGLHFQTFKAIIRRDGAYANYRKSYDFSSDLLRPMMETVDPQWGFVFGRFLVGRFQSAKDKCSNEMMRFTASFRKLLADRGASKKALIMFEQQISRFMNSVYRALAIAKLTVERKHKDANRLFAVRIEEEMNPIYSVLADEYGRGAYLRMKDGLKKHVDTAKDTMFAEAADSVKAELERMFAEVKKTLTDELDTLCKGFRQDCIHIISVKAREFAGLDEADQKMILGALSKAEAGIEALKVRPALEDAIGPALRAFEHESAEAEMPVEQAMDGIDALSLPNTNDVKIEPEFSDMEGNDEFDYYAF